VKFSNFRFLLKNTFSGSAVRPVGVKMDGRTDELMGVLIDLCRNPKGPKGSP
jgi:hypothetical protein